MKYLVDPYATCVDGNSFCASAFKKVSINTTLKIQTYPIYLYIDGSKIIHVVYDI